MPWALLLAGRWMHTGIAWTSIALVMQAAVSARRALTAQQMSEWLQSTGGRASRQRAFAAVLPAPDMRVEAREDPGPGRKRPGAKLLVRGSFEALLQMSGKGTSGGSPGGIRTRDLVAENHVSWTARRRGLVCTHWLRG